MEKNTDVPSKKEDKTRALPRKYTRGQLLAIIHSVELGKELVQKSPEIADLYREGRTHLEIAEGLGLMQKEGVTEGIAKFSIGLALRGYDGRFGQDKYNGLIEDKTELNSLARERRVKNANKLVEEKRGAFSLSPDERRRAASAGGKKSHSEEIGIFGLSDEERKDAGDKGRAIIVRERLGYLGLSADERKNACRLAVIAQGKTPWVERKETGEYTTFSEQEFAYRLSCSEEYQYQNGVNRGRPKNVLIARKLNELYHEGRGIRNAISVAHTLSRIRRNKTD